MNYHESSIILHPPPYNAWSVVHQNNPFTKRHSDTQRYVVHLLRLPPLARPPTRMDGFPRSSTTSLPPSRSHPPNSINDGGGEGRIAELLLRCCRTSPIGIPWWWFWQDKKESSLVGAGGRWGGTGFHLNKGTFRALDILCFLTD
jgi:hypothetical protein